jgi:predicted small lipoprotein YifL
MCKCWAQYLLIAVIFMFSLISLLTGCGIKGPVYLPDEKQADNKQSKAPESISTNMINTATQTPRVD